MVINTTTYRKYRDHGNTFRYSREVRLLNPYSASAVKWVVNRAYNLQVRLPHISYVDVLWLWSHSRLCY